MLSCQSWCISCRAPQICKTCDRLWKLCRLMLTYQLKQSRVLEAGLCISCTKKSMVAHILHCSLQVKLVRHPWLGQSTKLDPLKIWDCLDGTRNHKHKQTASNIWSIHVNEILNSARRVSRLRSKVSTVFKIQTLKRLWAGWKFCEPIESCDAACKPWSFYAWWFGDQLQSISPFGGTPFSARTRSGRSLIAKDAGFILPPFTPYLFSSLFCHSVHAKSILVCSYNCWCRTTILVKVLHIKGLNKDKDKSWEEKLRDTCKDRWQRLRTTQNLTQVLAICSIE